LRDGEHNS
jgi:hypothetical protein